MKTNIIYNKDCIEGMKELPDESVNLILCDLPYGTTACKWDTIIPFDKLWEQYKRILKNDGVIVLTSSQPFTSALIMSNPQMFREELCWLKNKSGSGLQANQKHIKIHENILVFSKNGKYTYNPQKWLVDKKEFLTQRKTFNTLEVGNNIYSKMLKTQQADDGSRNPVSVLSCRVPHNPSNTKEYNYFENDIRFHPTQKPLKLFEYLVETFSNENDVVLDNCMGVGTTALTCKKLNRQFIGYEIDPQYYKLSLERLSDKTSTSATPTLAEPKEFNIRVWRFRNQRFLLPNYLLRR